MYTVQELVVICVHQYSIVHVGDGSHGRRCHLLNRHYLLFTFSHYFHVYRSIVYRRSYRTAQRSARDTRPLASRRESCLHPVCCSALVPASALLIARKNVNDADLILLQSEIER